jgi:hypothetical protein
LKTRVTYSFILLLIFNGITHGQNEHYTVEKASFCSDLYDEFAPVLYRDGIVFCSNRSNDLFLSYKNIKDKNLINIYYTDIEENPGWKASRPLDLSLTTPFNDGPASLNADGNLIIYSRNQTAKIGIRNHMDPGNVLGIYYAEQQNEEWTNIRPFPFNDARYSLTMPALDSAGNTLIFVSDMPGGYGGTDLYLSHFRDEEWSEPENLGPVINSSGNEVYPFLSKGGILYFASDRPGGFGKKDIYRSEPSDNGWANLIHLEAPINTEFNDFGITCDDKFERGWFSSDRNRTDDIFYFETRFRPFYGCDSIQKNYYCFLFSEENYIENDSVRVRFEWSFSDGTILEGMEVEHCFDGPGRYTVLLKTIQTYADTNFVTETVTELELVDHEQVVIDSPDSCMVNDTVSFSGLDYNLPGFLANEYFWDFGDGTLEIGAELSHVYTEPGSYTVQLGLTGKGPRGEWQEKCVYKVMRVIPTE